MRLGAKPLSDMPKAYVQSLFDQYAPRFEQELIERLHYRAPAILFKAVLSVRAAQKKPAYFKRAIDLGCGTGLAARRPSPGSLPASQASTFLPG
jgi:predicted TPR repeat methyltransferase